MLAPKNTPPPQRLAPNGALIPHPPPKLLSLRSQACARSGLKKGPSDRFRGQARRPSPHPSAAHSLGRALCHPFRTLYGAGPPMPVLGTGGRVRPPAGDAKGNRGPSGASHVPAAGPLRTKNHPLDRFCGHARRLAHGGQLLYACHTVGIRLEYAWNTLGIRGDLRCDSGRRTRLPCILWISSASYQSVSCIFGLFGAVFCCL